MLYSVFVGHLPNDATKEELTELLSECGEVKDVYISPNPQRPFGYGFVRFTQVESVLKAAQEVGDWRLRGTHLKLEIASETKETMKQLLPAKHPTSKSVKADNSVRSRVKESCITINKALDLVHGDEPLHSAWVIERMTIMSSGYAPRLSGSASADTSTNLEMLWGRITGHVGAAGEEAQAEQEEDRQRKRLRLKGSIRGLLGDMQSHYSAVVRREKEEARELAALEMGGEAEKERIEWGRALAKPTPLPKNLRQLWESADGVGTHQQEPVTVEATKAPPSRHHRLNRKEAAAAAYGKVTPPKLLVGDRVTTSKNGFVDRTEELGGGLPRQRNKVMMMAGQTTGSEDRDECGEVWGGGGEGLEAVAPLSAHEDVLQEALRLGIQDMIRKKKLPADYMEKLDYNRNNKLPAAALVGLAGGPVMEKLPLDYNRNNKLPASALVGLAGGPVMEKLPLDYNCNSKLPAAALVGLAGGPMPAASSLLSDPDLDPSRTPDSDLAPVSPSRWVGSPDGVRAVSSHHTAARQEEADASSTRSLRTSSLGNGFVSYGSQRKSPHSHGFVSKAYGSERKPSLRNGFVSEAYSSQKKSSFSSGFVSDVDSNQGEPSPSNGFVSEAHGNPQRKSLIGNRSPSGVNRYSPQRQISQDSFDGESTLNKKAFSKRFNGPQHLVSRDGESLGVADINVDKTVSAQTSEVPAAAKKNSQGHKVYGPAHTSESDRGQTSRQCLKFGSATAPGDGRHQTVLGAATFVPSSSSRAPSLGSTMHQGYATSVLSSSSRAPSLGSTMHQGSATSVLSSSSRAPHPCPGSTSSVSSSSPRAPGLGRGAALAASLQALGVGRAGVQSCGGRGVGAAESRVQSGWGRGKVLECFLNR